MHLTKSQLEKLSDLEVFHFDESIRVRKEVDAIYADRFEEFGNGELVTDINGLMDAMSGKEIPFWNANCCTRMVDQKTLIENDGFCTMSWRVEWDHDAIKLFRAGCEWANKHGAGIPL